MSLYFHILLCPVAGKSSLSTKGDLKSLSRNLKPAPLPSSFQICTPSDVFFFHLISGWPAASSAVNSGTPSVDETTAATISHASPMAGGQLGEIFALAALARRRSSTPATTAGGTTAGKSNTGSVTGVALPKRRSFLNLV